MRIDLRGCNILMTEHFLYSTKIGTTFYQMRSKTVAKCMWRNCFFYSCFFCKLFYNKKDHHSCKLASAAIKKHNVFIAVFYRDMQTNIFEIDVHIFNGAATNRDQSFFIAFADHSYKADIKI